MKMLKLVLVALFALSIGTLAAAASAIPGEAAVSIAVADAGL
jgi:hypothetical protein